MASISDIQAEARLLSDSDSTSYTDAQLWRRINQGYEETVSLILNCDGRWQFEDENFTTYPIATTTLVDSQNDYSFETAHLEIERVEVKDSGGLWHLLSPIDISQVGEAIDEFYKIDGLPLYYDKNGKSLLLYPAPAAGSVTLAAGIKVYFKRTADLFTSAQVTTGTRVPGFPSPFHMILAYKAAIPFCVAYRPGRVLALMAQVLKFEDGIKKHFGRREQDRRKILSPSGVNSR